MSADRPPLLARLLRPITPRFDASFTPEPVRVADGVYLCERRMRISGATLPSNSTFLETAPGEWAVVSPPPDASLALGFLAGRIAHVIAPNGFHYLFAHAWCEAHPEALLSVAPGLDARVGGFAGARELAEPSVEGAPGLEVSVVGPRGGISEALLFHAPSRTLVLTDLAFHLVGFESRFDRIAWRSFGVRPGFGPSRNARRLLLHDRAHAGPALRRALEWNFERIVVGHGAVVEREAKARFERAFASYLQHES